MGYRNSAAQGLAAQLHGDAASGFEKIIVKDPGNNIDMPPQMPQYFPGVLGSVFKGHKFNTDIRAALVNPRPQFLQKMAGRHGGCADADLHLILFRSPLDIPRRLLAILYNVLSILIEHLSRFRQMQAPMGANKEHNAQAALEQVDLLDDSRRRYVHFFRCLAEAPGIRNAQKVSS